MTQAGPSDQVGDVAIDPHQRGSRSRGGFTFQDQCIALECVRGLLTGQLVAIDVELATDVVVHSRGQEPEFVLIKHRDPTQLSGDTGWRWSSIKGQSVFKDLYNHWNRSGRTGTATVWSDAGLVADAAKDLANVPDSQDEISDALVSRVAGLLEVDNGTAREFLARFHWPMRPFPRNFDIRDSLTGEVRKLLEQWGAEVGAYESVADDLLSLIEQTSLIDRRSTREATVAATSARADDNLRSGRRLAAEQLRDAILASARTATDAQSVRPDRIPRDYAFVGRSDLLDRLAHWYGDPPNASGVYVSVIVHGAIGVGKTALALQFAAERAPDGRAYVFHAPTAEDADVALRDLERVSVGDGRLVVVDGVDSVATLARFASRGWPFKVVITSTVAPGGLRAYSVAVLEWTHETAVEFLTRGIGPNEGLDRIVSEFGGNPLALSQVVATCRVGQMDADSYWARFGHEPGGALAIGSPDDPLLGLGITKQPRRSIAMSIRNTLALVQETTPSALALLRLICIFGPGSVSRSRLTSSIQLILNGKDVLTEADTEELKSTTDSTHVVREDRLERDLHLLTELSLVRPLGLLLVVHAAERLVVLEQSADLRTTFEYGLGSFFDVASGGLFRLTVQSTLEAWHAIELALKRGIVGPGLYNLALAVVPDLCALGSRDNAERLAELGEAWYKRLQGFLDDYYLIGARLGVLAAKLALDRVDEAIPLMFQAIDDGLSFGHPAVAAHYIERLAAIATEPARSELKSQVLELIPVEAMLTQLPFAVRVNIRLAQARLAYFDGSFDDAARHIQLVDEELLIHDPDGDAWGNVRREAGILRAGLARHDVQGFSVIDGPRLALARLEADHGSDAERTSGFVQELLELADGYLQTDDWVDAERQIHRARTLIRRFHPGSQRLQGKSALILGRMLMIRARFETLDALRHLEQARDELRLGIALTESCSGHVPPAVGSGWFHLAMVLSYLGDVDSAIEAAEHAVDSDVRQFGATHPEVKTDRALLASLRTRKP